MQKSLGFLVALGAVVLIGYGIVIGLPLLWGKVNEGLDWTIKKTEGKSSSDFIKRHGG